MTTHGLGGYLDWPAFLASAGRRPGAVASLFGVPQTRPGPVTEHEEFVRDDVRAVRLSWSVGFGPRLSAWLLHPADADPSALPGVLALHSHGGIKSVGAERMVDVPGVPPRVLAYRDAVEDGRAVATEVARAGFTVLAPDAFGWGSRRFDLGTADPEEHDRRAGVHEHLVAKACAVLDTTFAGMVAADDLTSLAVLRSRCGGDVGVLGFSGGGGRASVLCGLGAGVRAAVVVAMMVRLAALVPDHLDHSWLLHTRGLASGPDLAGLAAGDRAHHLLVGYCARDPLFPRAGMADADAVLAAAFEGATGSYTARWADTGHVFARTLQDAAVEHLRATLRQPPEIAYHLARPGLGSEHNHHRKELR